MRRIVTQALVLFANLIVLSYPGAHLAKAEPPTFSIRTISRTVMLDPAAGMPWREHRGADLLDRSGLGDEPFFIDPGPGPDIQVEAKDVLLIPLPDAQTAEIDAISATYGFPTDHFYLAFSVDFLLSMGVAGAAPFNVNQQWLMNHAEGDIFYALPEMRIGQVAPVPANLHIDPAGMGNTHSFSPSYPSNQTEFDLGPRAEPDMAWLDEDLYDDLDAFDFHSFTDFPITFPSEPLYLSVDAPTAQNNPALPALTGGDILVCETAGIFLWAASWDLGLQTTDDIDALVVFGDENLLYDPGDVVLFSLAPGSPTLADRGFSPADVLVAHRQAPPSRFASAASLGLRPEDDVDALAPVFDEGPFQVTTSVPPQEAPLVVRSFPNPFNPVTTLSFVVEANGRSIAPTRLEIFDTTGRLVRTLVDENLPPGAYTRSWDGTSSSGTPVGSGLFLYRLQVNGRSATGRLTLLR